MFEDLKYPQVKYADILLAKAGKFQEGKDLMKPHEEYKKLWTEARDLIVNDPLLQEYLKDGKSINKALGDLKEHFKGLNQPGLADQIDNMERMFNALVGIGTDMDLGFGADLINSHRYQKGHNNISLFVKYLNLLNGTKPEFESDPIEGDPAPSLLDQAYQFNKDNNYADVKTNPESFLVIRLGQICKDMLSKANAIYTMGNLLEAQNKEVNKKFEVDTYTDFIKNFKQSPEDFYAEVEQKLPELKKKQEQYQTDSEKIESLKEPEDWKFVNGNEEYKEVLGKYYRKNSVDAQNQAVKEAKEKHAHNVELQKSVLDIRNQNNKEYNEQALKDYQANLDFYEGQRQHLAELQSEKSEALKKIDDKLNPLKAERDREQQQIDTQAQELEKPWKEYNDKHKALEQKLKTVTKDVAEALDYAAVPATEDVEKYAEFRERRDIYNHVYNYLADTVGDRLSHDEMATWVNTALGSKHVTNEDLGNAALADDKEVLTNLEKIVKIQNAWGIFKLNHANDLKYKECIEDIDRYYGTFKDVKDFGALDAIKHGIEVNQQKMNQIRNKPENAKYFEAQNKLGAIVSRYPEGMLPSDADIKAMQQELDSMQAPTDPVQWKATKGTELANKYAEISELESEREQQIVEYDDAIINAEHYIKEAENLKEPELRTVMTQEEIEAEVDKYDKEHYNPEVEKQIKEKAFNEYVKTHHTEGVRAVQGHIGDQTTDLKHQISGIESKQENINKLFEHDKAKTNSDNESLENINSAIAKYNNDKNAYYQTIINDIDQYIANQSEGMKPGHTNTKEFNLMFTRMDEAKATLQRMISGENKPNSAELVGAFDNIKKATDNYEQRKKSGLHIGSTMHYARRNMAAQMGRFAEEKMKSIVAFEELGNKLVNDLNEKRPKENLRAVDPNATAKDHFTKMFKQAHPEMTAPKKQQPKPVSQMDTIRQEMEQAIKEAEKSQKFKEEPLKENTKSVIPGPHDHKTEPVVQEIKPFGLS